MDPLVGVGRKGLVFPFSSFLLSTCSRPGLMGGQCVMGGSAVMQGSAVALMCGGKPGERHPKSKLKP